MESQTFLTAHQNQQNHAQPLCRSGMDGCGKMPLTCSRHGISISADAPQNAPLFQQRRVCSFHSLRRSKTLFSLLKNLCFHRKTTSSVEKLLFPQENPPPLNHSLWPFGAGQVMEETDLDPATLGFNYAMDACFWAGQELRGKHCDGFVKVR